MLTEFQIDRLAHALRVDWPATSQVKRSRRQDIAAMVAFPFSDSGAYVNDYA